MIPKGKNKKKVKSRREESMQIIAQPSHDSIVDREFDLVNDLNDDFFNSANKTIQNLVQTKNLRDAARVKKIISILYNLHKRYVEERNINADLKPQVERANIKLRLALELTANSQEAMDQMKEALGESWRETDASQSREQDAQEKLYKLKAKCDKYEGKEDSNSIVKAE